MSRSDESLAARAVDRALASRHEAYTEEVRRLIKAGVRAMRSRGGLDPRVGEVVREAGLSNQAFYRHFRSKDEFLLAVLDDGVRELVAYLRHQMKGADSAGEQVRRWLRGVVAQARDPEAAEATRPFVVPQSRLAERFPAEVTGSVRELLALLQAAISRGVASGELPEADPERDARALYDLAMGWLQRALQEPELPSAEDADHLLAFAMRGLRRP